MEKFWDAFLFYVRWVYLLVAPTFIYKNLNEENYWTAFVEIAIFALDLWVARREDFGYGYVDDEEEVVPLD